MSLGLKAQLNQRRKTMGCPICLAKTGIELHHAEGFISGGGNLQECNHCKAVWLIKADGSTEVIKDGI